MHTQAASKQSWLTVVLVAAVLGVLAVAGGMAWIPSSTDMTDVVCGLDRLLVPPETRLQPDDPDALVCGVRVDGRSPRSGIVGGPLGVSETPWAVSQRL